jgi:hypothetical protein
MGILFKILYSITTFIQTLIVFRVLIDFFNVNKLHPIISWVFYTSDIFISPFEGIAPSKLFLDKFEIHLTPIVALVFYIIIAFVFAELAKTFKRTE